MNSTATELLRLFAERAARELNLWFVCRLLDLKARYTWATKLFWPPYRKTDLIILSRFVDVRRIHAVVSERKLCRSLTRTCGCVFPVLDRRIDDAHTGARKQILLLFLLLLSCFFALVASPRAHTLQHTGPHSPIVPCPHRRRSTKHICDSVCADQTICKIIK